MNLLPFRAKIGIFAGIEPFCNKFYPFCSYLLYSSLLKCTKNAVFLLVIRTPVANFLMLHRGILSTSNLDSVTRAGVFDSISISF